MLIVWATLLAQVEQESAVQQPKGFSFLEGVAWLGLIAVLAWLMLQGTRKRIAKSEARKELSVQQRVSERRQSTPVVDRITELMSELADMSRQVNGELDTRTAKLEVLLDETDRKVEILEKLLAVADSSQTEQFQTLSEPQAQPEDETEITADPADWQQSGADIDQPKPAEDVEIESDLDSPEHRQVIDLAKQGLNAGDIAREVGRPIGEVELILALGRKKT